MASHLRPVLKTRRGGTEIILNRNRDSSEAFDLAQDLDQALLPLRAGLGHREPHLPEAHVEDRAELRLEASLVAIPACRQSHHQQFTVRFDVSDTGRAGERL